MKASGEKFFVMMYRLPYLKHERVMMNTV